MRTCCCASRTFELYGKGQLAIQTVGSRRSLDHYRRQKTKYLRKTKIEAVASRAEHGDGAECPHLRQLLRQRSR